MATWTRRTTLIYPLAGLSDVQKDAVAQAYVTVAALETFPNERAMFDKAAPLSSDYGTTETRRAISSAMTEALWTAVKAALTGATGTWYLLDAQSGTLLDTNDAAKKPGATVTHGLQWTPGVAYATGEIVEYQGTLYSVIQGHTSQATWTPDIAAALFKRYIAPGQVTEWRQPQGSHDAYPIGARVAHAGTTWINTTAANVWEPGVTGWTDENAPSTPEWTYPKVYAVGDEVTYQGQTYRCRQAHTSQAGWTPPAVPSLWLLL